MIINGQYDGTGVVSKLHHIRAEDGSVFLYDGPELTAKNCGYWNIEGGSQMCEPVYHETPLSKRVYLCIWGGGGYDNAARLHSFAVFTEDHGYDKDSIESIKRMDVLDVARIEDDHIIIRMYDDFNESHIEKYQKQ